MSNYSIGQTAVLVGKPGEPLPVSTIRNWTRQYSEFLSADANPTPGQERRYDASDIAVLRKIHELRKDRLIESDIVVVLRQAPPVPVEVLPADEPSEPETSPPAIQPAQDTPGTALAVPVVLDDLLTRIARIEATNATAPQQQRKLAVWVAVLVGVAVVLGVIVGGALVWMVLR